MGFGIGGFNGGGGTSGGSSGGSTGQDPLTIGNVQLLDEEHPDDLSFELTQVWAIHVNIGGSKVAQALGPNPSDVTWMGHLFGGNVQPRLAALKALEVAAQPVSLSYLDQSYTVVVKKFTSKYYHRYLAEYTIAVAIILDTSGQYTQTPPSGIDDQVTQAEQQAQAALQQLNALDPNGSSIALAQWNLLFAELAGAGPLAGLAGPALQSLINLAGGAYEAMQSYLSGLGSSSTQTSTQQFILASQLSSLATVISRNLQQGQAPQVIKVLGGSQDLFDIAAQVYGDASLAFALASANGLITPVLSSGVSYTIVLPPLSSIQSAA